MNSVTAIVNGYRRPNNLPIQVEALRNQTNPPDEIWLWMNYHEDFDKEKQYKLEALGVDKICYNDHNWKYFGRLALAMLAQTNFVAILMTILSPVQNGLKIVTHPTIMRMLS